MPSLTDADFFTEFMTPEYDEGAAKRLVESLAAGVNLEQAPGGSDFLYSDIGYDILADLIHNVSGLYFEEYMRRNILQPLRMKDSSFLLSEVDPRKLVLAHVTQADGTIGVWDYQVPYDRKHAPSSCLHSSVEDYANWLLMNMNAGRWHGKTILPPNRHAGLWEMLYLWNPLDVLQGYGWGCELGEFYDRPIVTNFGGQPGVQSMGGMLPNDKMGVIVMVNILGSFTPDWVPYVADVLGFWALEWLVTGVVPASPVIPMVATASLRAPVPVTNGNLYLPWVGSR
jgi:CubicO group peptidase (beta-lactamase class C family)